MNPSSWRYLTLVLVFLLTACGGGGSTLVGATSSFEADASTDPIVPSFNVAYQERISANEKEARSSTRNTHYTLFRIIQRSQESLEGAFFDIEALDVVDEIIAAKKRGVKVRLVTDSDNMVEKSDPSKPREAIRRLQKAGIPVAEDKRSGFMHHKFMVLDGHTVWMGSTNLTPNSLYHHNNNALTIRSKELAGLYQQEFERLFTDRAFGSSERSEVTPGRVMSFKNGSVQAFFSPRGGGRKAVLDEVDKARKRVRLLTFSFTDAELGMMLLDKAENGVKVEGVFDRWLAASRYSLYSKFKQAGLNVWLDGNEALMHHKVILIDDDTLITGSYNYSQNAEYSNNESFVIVRNAKELVEAYDAEFKRVMHAAKTNKPPATKPKDAEIRTGDTP